MHNYHWHLRAIMLILCTWQQLIGIGTLSKNCCIVFCNQLRLPGKNIGTLSPFPCFDTDPFNIELINLSNNVIETIPARTFKDFPNVTNLDLSYNLICSLSFDAFIGLKNLVILNLSGNNLRKIVSYQFTLLRSLKALAIMVNKITRIESNAFAQLENLSVLTLERNLLPAIESDNFKHLTSLTSLLLAENKITYLGDKAFSNNPYLQIIDLSDNLLTDDSNLTSDQFIDLVTLESISLLGNPLSQATVDALRAALPNVTILF